MATKQLTRRSRWVLVGTGGIARLATQDLKATKGLEVVGVVSRQATRAQSFADEHDLPKAFKSLEAALADDTVDLIYLGSPAATHAPLAEQALLAGKHVLAEKRSRVPRRRPGVSPRSPKTAAAFSWKQCG